MPSLLTPAVSPSLTNPRCIIHHYLPQLSHLSLLTPAASLPYLPQLPHPPIPQLPHTPLLPQLLHPPILIPDVSPSLTTAASYSHTPAVSPSLTYCSFLTSLLTLAVSSSLNYLSCLVPLLTPAAKLFSFFTHLYDTMPLSSFDLEPSRVTSETGMWTAWSPPASATGAWFVSTTITQPKCCTWEKRQPLQELMTQSSFGRAMPMKDTKSRLQSHVQLPVSRSVCTVRRNMDISLLSE